MPPYVIVLSDDVQLFEHVKQVLLSDSRFIDDGDNIHCDGIAAPLANIYAVDANPTDWEDWVPEIGMPDPRTMSSLLLECRSSEWVATIGQLIAQRLDEPVWLVDSADVAWPAGSVDPARITLV